MACKEREYEYSKFWEEGRSSLSWISDEEDAKEVNFYNILALHNDDSSAESSDDDASPPSPCPAGTAPPSPRRRTGAERNPRTVSVKAMERMVRERNRALAALEKERKRAEGAGLAVKRTQRTVVELQQKLRKQAKQMEALREVNRRVCLERAQALEREEAALVGAGSRECSVCMNAPLECLLSPCNHLSLCLACARAVDRCPVCRGAIVARTQVFVAT